MMSRMRQLAQRLLAIAALLCAACTASTSPECFAALNAHCSADNMLGFTCDGCVAASRKSLTDAGCQRTDFLNFCEGVTVDPITCDVLLQTHCANTQTNCDKCTFCAYQQAPCSLVKQRSFCHLMCGGTDGTKIELGGGKFTFTQDEITSCMLAAEKVCGHDNDPGDPTLACSQCIDGHKDALRAGKCDDTNGDGHLDASDLMLSYFCSASSCIPKLADKCRDSTCIDCASCAASHRQETGCRETDEVSFCAAMKPPAPKQDWWRGKKDPCLAALTQCNKTLGAARKKGQPFTCTDLKNVAACAAGKAGSHCTEAELKVFGEASTCDATVCGLRGSCNIASGSCECVTPPQHHDTTTA